MNMIERLFRPPEKQSFFLFGPRGTGKSTFIREYYQNALYLDFLLPKVERDYRNHPELLIEVVDAHMLKEGMEFLRVIIDEVQKVPSILSVVHAILEDPRFKDRIQFILTGSNARKLKRVGVDLLGGRAWRCTLHPFMAVELGAVFDFKAALQGGLLPLLHNNKDDRSTGLEAYIDLYLKEEIQTEGLVRNLDNFSRFLQAVSFSHGSVCNISNMANECGVKRKTTEGYLSILEDLLLAYKIPVFSKKAKRDLVQHSKLYLFDVGVFRSLRPHGPLDQPEEIDGMALEGLVAQHLRAWVEYSSKSYELYYWRTRSQVEVDFVLYGQDVFWGIEVKNTQNPNPKDFRGLKTFLEDYPMAKAILLHRGKEFFRRDQILCMPCEEFLKTLKPDEISAWL
ncbi:MAG: ATP-binding protein [Gammaproteobacteria bacterium]